MKNIITIKTTLVSLILCMLLAGCSDLNGGSKTCTVTGAISMSDVDNSRSATSSFTDWDSVSLYAEQGSNKIAGSVTNGSYSVVLNSSGQWTITAYVESSSTKILQGSVTVTIPDPVESVTNAHIVLLPCFNSEITGNISLKIMDETTGSKLSKVTFKGTGLSAGTATFTNGLATVSIPSCQPKSYDVAFSFEDSIGNTLYKCRETITVFSGLTTGTWSGDGTHLRKTAQGTTEFVITDELVSGYGTDLLPDTKMALYTYDYDSSAQYPYHLVDSASAGVSGTADVISNLSNSTDYNPIFCFDNSGRLYAFSRYYNDGSTICEINTSSTTYSINLSNVSDVYSFSLDRKTDIVYILSNNDVYTCEKDKMTDIASNSEKIGLLTSFSTYNSALQYFSSSRIFSVYDNVMYRAVLKTSGDNATLYLVKADLSNPKYDSNNSKYVVTMTDSDVSEFSLSDISNGISSLKISDMLYQDGYLYILVRDLVVWTTMYTPEDNNPFISRGALIRVNLFNNELSVLGWTNNKIDLSNAGAYIKEEYGNNYYYSDAEKTSLFVVDGTQLYNGDSNIAINTLYPIIYAPDGGKDLSTSAFYGPEKFIAIKPKKLVIADDGIAYYTNADGALAYRNVNRVVVVDLENFAMESWNETSAQFAGGASSEFCADYGRVICGNDNLARGANFYYATSFTGSIYDSNGARVDNVMNEDMYLAMKCEDND